MHSYWKILKEKKKETFDLELELKLAREKLAKGKFDLTKIYIDSVIPKVKSSYKKLGIAIPNLKKQYVDRSHVQSQIKIAKNYRNKVIEAEQKAEEFIKKAKKTKKKKSMSATTDRIYQQECLI